MRYWLLLQRSVSDRHSIVGTALCADDYVVIFENLRISRVSLSLLRNNHDNELTGYT